MKESKRNSAFELMRIVAMLMVVWGHCVLATAQNTRPYLGIIDNIGWIIGAFTVCAVNLFFLLTGYYANTNFDKYVKVIKIWLKTIFYSVLIFCISNIIIHNNESNIIQTVGYFLPIFTKKYWYMQVYVVLALISPYLNSMLDTLDAKKHLKLILILLLFFSIHESFIKVRLTLDQTQGYGITWGTVVFIVGNYINRYGDRIISKIKKQVFLVAYLMCSVAIFASNYVIVRYGIAGGITSRGNFYAYNSVSVFIQSVLIFLFFVRLSMDGFSSGIVNYLGQNTLAVYLISAHPVLLYPLWTNIFGVQRLNSRPFLYVVCSFLLTLFVMAICINIDKIVNLVFHGAMRITKEHLIKK